MSEQYYLDPTCSAVTGSEAVLGGDEAHHFLKVMRGKSGDPILLFDGKGLRFRGVVETVRKMEIGVHIFETNSASAESSVRLTIATALPKGDRQKFLVEKLTELGVARLIPLRCERGVSKVDDGVLERLRRQVIEASKQSMRSVLMQIGGELTFAGLETAATDKFLLHPLDDSAIGQTPLRSLIDAEWANGLLFAVGPEGGFTDTETTDALQSGFRPVDLGPRILRTETACIAVAAAVLCSFR